jgi:hypothetical protein
MTLSPPTRNEGECIVGIVISLTKGLPGRKVHCNMANASPDRLFRSALLRLGRLYNFDYAGDVHCQLNFKIPMAVLELLLDIELS